MPFPTSTPSGSPGGQPPRGTPRPSGRKAAFNVQLDDSDYARLDALAGVTSRSRGAVVREALKFMHQHLVQGVPTCASGQICPVPNLHRPNPLAGPEVPTR